MSLPLIVWSCIAALFILILLAGIARHALSSARTARHSHIIGIGSEREEFYVPGDKRSLETYDYEDIDDL